MDIDLHEKNLSADTVSLSDILQTSSLSACLILAYTKIKSTVRVSPTRHKSADAIARGHVCLFHTDLSPHDSCALVQVQ